MRNRRLLRLVALTLGFAAMASGGAPLLDSVLYHHGGGPSPFRIQWDKEGGGGQHAEQCAIMSQRPAHAVALGHPDAGRAVSAAHSTAVAFFAPRAPVPSARLLPESRAPPRTSV